MKKLLASLLLLPLFSYGQHAIMGIPSDTFDISNQMTPIGGRAYYQTVPTSFQNSDFAAYQDIRLILDTLTYYVTPNQFGAIPGDGTDDGVAYQATIDYADANKVAVLSNGDYTINTPVNIPSGVKIFGYGAFSIIRSTANITIFSLLGDNATIAGIKFIGNRQTGQSGIRSIGPSDKRSNIISQCHFFKLGNGIYSKNHTLADHPGTIYVETCLADSCLIGFNLDERSEYNLFNNCSAVSNDRGFVNIGGNNSWVGGNISNNKCGVFMKYGDNDGHCIMTGAKINHNDTAIFIDSLSRGYEFTANEIHTGYVYLRRSTDVKFSSNQFNSNRIIIDSTTRTTFQNNNYYLNPISITNNNPSTVRWFNNDFAEGNTFGIGSTLLNNLTVTGKTDVPQLGIGTSTVNAGEMINVSNPTAGAGTNLIGLTWRSATTTLGIGNFMILGGFLSGGAARYSMFGWYPKDATRHGFGLRSGSAAGSLPTSGAFHFWLDDLGNAAFNKDRDATAKVTIGAGGTAANTAPLKFTSGPLMTTAEVGAVEFLTDKPYFTITTGSARKEYTLNDAALTVGIVPITTTNGRLTSSTVTTTELGYVSGVTSAIQTQLNTRAIITTLTGSGDGVSTAIAVTLPASSTNVMVGAANAAASGITYWTVSGTTLTINYAVAPANGTNNLSYWVEYK